MATTPTPGQEAGKGSAPAASQRPKPVPPPTGALRPARPGPDGARLGGPSGVGVFGSPRSPAPSHPRPGTVAATPPKATTAAPQSALAKAGSAAVEGARERIAKVVYGHKAAVDALLVALAAGGHVLLDGIPGVGKTTLARTFAQVTGLQFHRIQLTPDLMPADITGHNYYDQEKKRFELRPGPIMAQVVLADEINRTPPRTQAALLEAMQERQVTIEGKTLPLPDPFLLVATKNPIDLEGVYPLPGAELDRFMLSVLLEYPGRDVEATMLRGTLHHVDDPKPVHGMVDALRAAFRDIEVHPDIVDYVLDVVTATRKHAELILGASPRAARHWLEAARGLAAVRGRSYVTPDDAKAMAVPVLRHRLVLRAEAELAGLTAEAIVRNLLEQIPVPIGRRA